MTQKLELFSTFRQHAMKAKNVTPFVGRLLALDPGETTGWSLFIAEGNGDVFLDACGQVKTWEIQYAVDNLSGLLHRHQPNIVVNELYSVYEWKSQDHSWSEVPTIQVIGCLRTLLYQQSIWNVTQTAQIAKNFMTDAKLKSWGLWQEGQRHARDSIRHGAYYLSFGKSTDKQDNKVPS